MTSKIKVDNIANQSDSNIVNKCSTTITVGTGSDTTNVPGAAVVTGNVTGANVIASSNVVKSNAYQASDAGNIISQSGTTITIGASGDTVSLASGASQSGFGRAGSVDWQTGSIKTADFTAANGEGYFVNTTSGVVTVTLPSSPSAGNIVAIADYAGTAATNKITINRNSSPFEGGTANGQITVNRQAVTLVYVDGTQGWIPTTENDSSFQQPLFTVATGGTITTSGDFKIHTFTGPGTFCVSQVGNAIPGGGPGNVDYLVLAGGGGGGSGIGGAGGGGAGGHRTTFPSPGCNAGSFAITASPFPITVGGGGAFPTPGSNSIFSTITSAGGGSGGGPCGPAGQNGGSGGGGAGTGPGGAKGNGNTPPVSPPQGNDGGTGTYSQPNTGCTSTQTGGGGGGANAAGTSAPGPAPGPKTAGAGGAGVANSITGSPVTRGGGGGGGASDAPGGANQGNRAGGGSGGGGNGTDSRNNGTSGEANRGGGGGGNGHPNPVAAPLRSGGSGIVIIRYKFQ